MNPVIAISMGDYNGIGPEVILKTIRDIKDSEVTPLLTGHPSVFEYYLDTLDVDLDFQSVRNIDEIKKDGKVYLLVTAEDSEIGIEPGSITRNAGKCSMKAVEKAADLCMTGKADAMVTAPISKEAIQKAGYNFPGHTEFLAELTSTRQFMMILVSNSLRVGLATVHVPLSDVPKLITSTTLTEKIGLFNRSLSENFGIKQPKLAVFGLNPHAGDGGVIGKEEISIISPVIEKMTKKGMDLDGPFAADGFFGNNKHDEYDGILAMYHDQGLIPFKTLSFGKGVNFTAGLPIIRTSPDHGTAYDIAGKNRASHHSFREALNLANNMAINRKRKKAG